MMAYETMEYEARDAVAYVTWNRPEKLNAMSLKLRAEFCDALLYADGDPAIKVVVVKGAGRAFSSGYELQPRGDRRWPGGLPGEMDAGEFIAENVELMKGQYRYANIIADMQKPVIAAVHGWCLGEGSFAAVLADITIASDAAVFGAPEIREGQPAMPAWMFACGWKNAMRYCLTGDHLDAAEALRIGLVNEVVPRDQLDDRVAELARRMTLIPTDSLILNKLMIRQILEIMGYRAAAG